MGSERSGNKEVFLDSFAALGIICAVSGVLIFSRGFLLTRSELTNTTNVYLRHKPEFDRVILILVDGLYAGLIPPLDTTSRMPFLRTLLNNQNYSKSYFLAHFIADPPTTTMQRLKGLLTGSMPTFIDAGSNFGGSKLQEDNILKQWFAVGKKVCFVGDQVWVELVPDGFRESHPMPSFNIKDLDSVDTAVKTYILKEVEQEKCDVIIGHMLGIDHCGHTFGRSHLEMNRKLGELDQFLGELLSKLRSSDLLVVFGDHGMTYTGDHGGDSDAEIDAALFAFTPSGFPRAPPTDVALLPSVEQVSLVPTLAALTGTPIPFSNLGVVVTQLFGSSMVQAVNENYVQMHTYAKEYNARFGLHAVPPEMQQRMELSSSQPCSAATLQDCLSELRSLRSVFQIHWTRMDPWAITSGFLLTFLALLAFLCYEANIDKPGILTTIFVGISVVPSLMGFTHFAFLPIVITFYRLVLALWLTLNWKSASLGTAVSTVMIGILALTASSNSFVVQEAAVLTCLLQSLLVFTGLFTLNSVNTWFRVVGGRLLLCSCLFWAGRYLEICREESPSCSPCVILGGGSGSDDPSITSEAIDVRVGLLTRLTALSGDWLSQLAGVRLAVAFFCLWATMTLLRKCLQAWGNLKTEGIFGLLLSVTTAPLVPATMLSALWLLDVVVASTHSANGHASSLVRLLDPKFMSGVRTHLARGIFVLAGVILLTICYNPLLVTAVVLATEMQSSVTKIRSVKHYQPEVFLRGLPTVYISWILLALTVVPLLVLLVLLGDIYVVPSIALLACLLLPPIYYITSDRPKKTPKDFVQTIRERLYAASNWNVAIFACLLGELGFFWLGHQATFPSIVWEAAFSILEGDRVSSSKILPGSLVLANTFAAQIIVTASLPLVVVLAVHEMSSKGSVEALLLLTHSKVISSALREAFDSLFRRHVIAHFSLFTGHMLCAFVLRRHLMVWKIFAPRLVFSFCGLVVVVVVTLLVRGLLVLRLHKAVESLRCSLFTEAPPSADFEGTPCHL